MSDTTATPAPLSHAATRPPTLFELLSDRGFRTLTWMLAWLSVGVLFMVVLEIGGQAMPAIKAHGASLVTQSEWHASEQHFGILPHIFGTIYTSVLALFIATVLGVAVAIFITEDFLPPNWRTLLKNIVELLAAIPSVIYGLWGIYVVIPALRKLFSFSPALSNAFNGPADDHRPGARRHCQRPAETPRRSDRSGRDALGNDFQDHPADGRDRHRRRGHARIWPGAGRDNGPGHARRQHQQSDL